jgi:cyclic lactone autoinducer peptide
MKTKIRNLVAKANVKMLSSCAAFALIITTMASNQRCWYVLHEEKLPENSKKLRKF